MSEDSKKRMRIGFAERAVTLAQAMAGQPPAIFLCDPGTNQRETPRLCPLSGEAGRVAVLSMTLCNPLALQAASIIEGGRP